MVVRHGRKFVDRVRVLAAGGDGGGGAIAFYRDNKVSFGPPTGGSGGRGGDVVVRATNSAADLHLATRNFRAEHGGRGGSSEKTGRRGATLEVSVPAGTAVEMLGAPDRSRQSRMAPADAPATLLAELMHEGDSVTVARGGAGGRGNMAFKSGKLQGVNVAEDGFAGEAVTLRLALKLVADVGLVGFPNAGKSSLLRAISRAEPEVAAYPFTTLHPHLGVATTGDRDTFTVADIPGLIEGAHANRGLGHAFLQHVERTSLLAYVLDLGAAALPPAAQLRALRRELELYQPGLGSRACVVLANKADVGGAAERLRELRAEVAAMVADGELASAVAPDDGGSRVTAVSAREEKNLARATERLFAALTRARQAQARQAELDAERAEAEAARAAEEEAEIG